MVVIVTSPLAVCTTDRPVTSSTWTSPDAVLASSRSDRPVTVMSADWLWIRMPEAGGAVTCTVNEDFQPSRAGSVSTISVPAR